MLGNQFLVKKIKIIFLKNFKFNIYTFKVFLNVNSEIDKGSKKKKKRTF